MMYPDLFINRYPDTKFKERSWIQDLDKDERKSFARLGYDELMHSYGYEYGFQVFHVAGGVKRARTAKRDSKGRFIKNV